MVRDQKMAFTGRYLPKYIQIYFFSAFENSLNSLPSETAVHNRITSKQQKYHPTYFYFLTNNCDTLTVGRVAIFLAGFSHVGRKL